MLILQYVHKFLVVKYSCFYFLLANIYLLSIVILTSPLHEQALACACRPLTNHRSAWKLSIFGAALRLVNGWQAHAKHCPCRVPVSFWWGSLQAKGIRISCVFQINSQDIQIILQAIESKPIIYRLLPKWNLNLETHGNSKH